MDNAQKAIMIGVGLFITIIIIAAVMLITGIAQGLINEGTNKLSTVSTTLQSQLTSQYDNVQVTGAQVLAAVQKYYSDPDLVIGVINEKGSSATTVWTTPNKVASNASLQLDSNIGRYKSNMGIETNAQPSYGTFTSATSSPANRIVTTGQYQSYLIDLNGSVLGIMFVRK